jgi:NADP-dependent 3-hydroxy acid dehydrogenase YdfG
MISTDRLHDNWVVITGATSGIGKACAELFAEAGANLILTGRRQERLETLSKNLHEAHSVRVETSSFDVRDRQACKKFVEELSHPVNILINNAGLAVGKDPVDAAEFEDWDRMIDTNVKGLLNMTRLIVPGMKERNRGQIINLGSTAGHEAYAGGVVYCATKHAVDAITKSMKKDLHGTAIRVGAVSPGLVETEFSNVRLKGDDAGADKVYEGMVPLTGKDIAEIVLFMASRPDHVNIMDSIIYPVQQSSSTMVDRSR